MNTVAFAELTLTWDEFHWTTQIEDLGPLGKWIEFLIETEDEEKIQPHALQLGAWTDIRSNPLRYLDLIRGGLFRYYCDIRPQYEKAGPEWVARMPVLSRKEEIDSLLTLNYISIHWPYDGEMPKVGFSFWCEWDEEHGAGVVIRDGVVIDAGSADCAI